VWRRFRLYAAATVVAIGLEGLIYAGFVIPPLLTTLVYAFVWADGDAEPPGLGAIWERVLERSWAVLVVDLVTSLILAFAQSYILAGDALEMLTGFALFGVSASLVFADTSATVDAMPVWWMLPGAFWRSVQASMRGPTLPRAIVILGLVLLVALLQAQLYDLLQRTHVAAAEFWSQVPLEAASVPPIAALTALVYRDATRTKVDADAHVR
jgi:hypothetical protein